MKKQFTRDDVINIIECIMQHADVVMDIIQNENTGTDSEDLLELAEKHLFHLNVMAETREAPNAFDVYAHMNKNDAAKKTETLCMSPYFISANTCKGGGAVSMGVDVQTLHNLALKNEGHKCVLLVYKKSDYDAAVTEIMNQ